MKPKNNYKAEKNGTSYDDCNTPPYALDPILPYLEDLPDDISIWEPAEGMGILAERLCETLFREVIRTGLPHFNYFDYEPRQDYVQVTNPPYGIKLDWLKLAYARGKPFALLMPEEMTGNRKAQDLFEKYGIQILHLTPRVDFIMPHSELYGNGAQFPVAWYTWNIGVPDNGFQRTILEKPSHKEQILWWEFWKSNHTMEYWRWWENNAYPIGTKVTTIQYPGVFEITKHMPGTLQMLYEITRGSIVINAFGWFLKPVKEKSVGNPESEIIQPA